MPRKVLTQNLASGALDPIPGILSSGIAAIPHAALTAEDLTVTAPTQPTATGANSVTVTVTGTATTNGTNLRTAYTAAKALTPGGNALSASNRAMVILPAAEYDMGSTTFTLDANFVDLIAQTPVNPITASSGAHLPLSTDDSTETVAQSLSEYRPTGTVVKNSTAHNTITQSVADVRLIGFTVANLLATFVEGENANGSAFVATVANSASYYGQMYFWSRLGQWFTDGVTNRAAVAFRDTISGTWIDCIANNPSWLGGGAITGMRMQRCYASPYSFSSSDGMTDSVFLDVTIEGISSGRRGSAFQFERGDIGSDCVFRDCRAGVASFGAYESTVAGTFIRCTGGDRSFAGAEQDLFEQASIFSGYAEDCTAGVTSFGGYQPNLYLPGQFTGVAIRCTAKADGSFGMPATGTTQTGVIGGLMLQCTLTVGSWTAPNVPGALQLQCVNADASLVTRQFFGVPVPRFRSGGSTGPANAGSYTLVAGEVEVSDPETNLASVILVGRVRAGGTLGDIYVDYDTLNPGVGFTIKSTNAADTSDVFYIRGIAE